MMKPKLLIVVAIVSGFIVLVALSIFVVPTMEANHQKECHYDGGKVTSFLQCTRVHMDYSLEPTTVFINLGALDPQSKNPIFPKEMTVVLGENNTVTWLNRDGPSHFINFENWAIGPIHQGERQSITFNHTGVYEYFSADSPSILGTIIVKPGPVSETNHNYMTLEQSKQTASSEPEPVTPPTGLQVDVTGQQQVRRGTTHDITVDVFRNANPVSDAFVRITIEDYGEDVIRDFKGRTDDSGRFVFSWEIPKSFDDIKTLLAYVDVTDDISAKTILFKFQVYCLPGEKGCKVEGN